MTILQEMVADTKAAVQTVMEKVLAQTTVGTKVGTVSPTDWIFKPETLALPPQGVERYREKLAQYRSPSLADEVIDLLEGDYRYTNREGRIATRLSNAYFKKFKSTFSGTPALELENIINVHKHGDIFYRIQPKLDWPSGEYGDSGSCMWSYHRIGRAILCNVGAVALLVRKAERLPDGTPKMTSGAGRCWVIPYKGNFFMCNFYGTRHEIMLGIMSHHLGVELPYVYANVHATVNLNGKHYHQAHQNSLTMLVQWKGGKIPTREIASKEVQVTEEACYCIASAANYNAAARGGSKPVEDIDNRKMCVHCPFKSTSGRPMEFTSGTG